MKYSNTVIILVVALIMVACNKSKEANESTAQKDSHAKKSLIQIAERDSKGRVIYDAQGYVVEMDLREIQISDEFVDGLSAPELKSLQVLKVSGEYITDRTISRLIVRDVNLKRIVFEGTKIKDPKNHPGVRKYQEDTGVELIFTNGNESEQAGRGHGDKPSN